MCSSRRETTRGAEPVIMWVLVGAVAVIGLVVVLVAAVRDPELPDGGPDGPSWDLPTPAELRDARFPVSWQGYDPAHVDAWVAAVADAWDVLVDEADPQAVERARARIDGRGPVPADGPDGTGRPAGAADPSGVADPSDADPSGEELEDGGGDRAGILDR